MARQREDRRRAPVITSARFSRTLDNSARRRRYLWTMGVRVVCFLSATVAPWPWNLVLLLAAAVLPAMAVMLANAIDLRSQPPAPPADEPVRPALSSPQTVPGHVVDDDR